MEMITMGMNNEPRREERRRDNKQHVGCFENFLIFTSAVCSFIMSVISSVDSGPLHVKPEVNLNLSTEANRILYVLEKIISRAKLVGLLKEFVKDDGFLLKDILEPNIKFKVIEEYRKCLALAWIDSSNSLESLQSSTKAKKHSEAENKKYIYEKEESEGLNGESTSVASDDHEKKKKRNHVGIVEVIYLLEENSKVRKLAASMEKELPPKIKFFIKCLTEFKKRMKVRLSENSTQYKTKEKYMREIYQKNEKAKKEIKRLEEELITTKTEANVCLIGKNILIKRHHNKIEKIKNNTEEVIEKKVCESERIMAVLWKSSIINQEQLKQDFLQISEQYSSLLKENLAIEKVLRTKRAKVENQVLGWIQKFDQEIGEKQAEEEEIQGMLDEETREVQDLQSKLEEQEEEYDELMQEKAQFEEEMLDRRLYTFIINRSARRIQRTYRLYKARKLAKKLSRKGRKGKKKS